MADSRRRELRVLAPTGNLGHSTIREASYREGLERDPHFVVADAGSADIGPSFLGADAAHNPVAWDRMDLELLLTTTRERDIPLIIGSSGGTGTGRGVALFLELIREIAAERRLPPFRLGTIYADVDLVLLCQIRIGRINSVSLRCTSCSITIFDKALTTWRWMAS